MDSKALSLLKGNPIISNNQIRPDVDDFVKHPPALLPIFADLDEEVDLTFGGLNFRVGNQGSLCLSTLISSDLSDKKPVLAGSTGNGVNSTPEVEDSIAELTEAFNEISIEYYSQDEVDQLLDNAMKLDYIDLPNLEEDFTEFNGVSYLSQEKADLVLNEYMEFEDFTDPYDGVSDFPQNEWQPGLQLHGHPTIEDSEPCNDDDLIQYLRENPILTRPSYFFNLKEGTSFVTKQMCVIVHNEEVVDSEEIDFAGNPFVDPENPARGTAVIETGEDGSRVRPRVKIPLAAWNRARAAMTGTPMPVDATRE